MKRSNRLVIFVGVLLAILAFVGIVILLSNQQPRPYPDSPRNGSAAGREGGAKPWLEGGGPGLPPPIDRG